MDEHCLDSHIHERQDKLLFAVNNAAVVLLTTTDEAGMNASLAEAMDIVGRAVEADRVQLWRNELINGELFFVHSYEWLSEFGQTLTPVPVGLKFPYDAKPGWKQMFMDGEYINGPLSELPKEDQDFLNGFDIKTIIIIPLFLEGDFWGFFSLDDCQIERRFTEDEIAIFRSVSLMMANAVARHAQANHLKEAHERTKLLVEAMPLSCRLWNRDAEIFDYNTESIKLFNLKDGEELKSRYFDLSPKYQPDGQLSREKAVAMLNQAFEEGRLVLEWESQTLDGTVFPTEITLVRVKYGDDYVVAGYTRDLREQKKLMDDIHEASDKLEEALKSAQAASDAKSDFLASMSHEMRTPLNAII